ncbi:MAG: hypothetical protein LDL33_06795 [Desulfomonile sp.]|nr:hypothetical protein [Desulfomonile sp.]
MEVEKLIYSIIPLVLIIFFSWLFSVVGSRMKRQIEEEGPGLIKSPGASQGAGMAKSSGDPLMDLFGRLEDEKIVVTEEKETSPRMGGMPKSGTSEWGMYQDLQAPRVSPEPITPKWWGA